MSIFEKVFDWFDSRLCGLRYQKMWTDVYEKMRAREEKYWEHRHKDEEWDKQQTAALYADRRAKDDEIKRLRQRIDDLNFKLRIRRRLGDLENSIDELDILKQRRFRAIERRLPSGYKVRRAEKKYG